MAELIYFNDNGVVYAFVSGFTEIIYDSVTYEPTPVKRSELKLSDNFAKTPLSFYFSRSNYFAQKILHTIPEHPIEAKLFDSETSELFWIGKVLKAKASLVSIEVICDSSYAAHVRAGNRYIVSSQCQHILYSTACGASSEMYRTNLSGVTIDSSTIQTITGLTADDGFYNNGAISFSNETRRILKQIGTTVYLASPFNTTGTGVVSLFPGCNLTSKNCLKFNNLVNQLAFEFSPDKSPFKSGILV